MLDQGLKSQLKTYLENLRHPVVLVASLDASAKSAELQALLADVAQASDKITVREDGTDGRVPSFTVGAEGSEARVTFAGLPMGHEFTSLVLALLQAGGHPPRVEAEVIDQVKALDADLTFETYFSLTCQNCPDVVQAL
ncbi:MAG: alkyl hydroperoxide reductase subunit F, partial [Phenylobacterium sp.]|nr:alkyl hydroperoxide reductase subunit F [Phenylobacterium sp.]